MSYPTDSWATITTALVAHLKPTGDTTLLAEITATLGVVTWNCEARRGWDWRNEFGWALNVPSIGIVTPNVTLISPDSECLDHNSTIQVFAIFGPPVTGHSMEQALIASQNLSETLRRAILRWTTYGDYLTITNYGADIETQPALGKHLTTAWCEGSIILRRKP